MTTDNKAGALEVAQAIDDECSRIADEICGCATREQHRRDIDLLRGMMIRYYRSAHADLIAENERLRTEIEKLKSWLTG